MVSYKYLPLCGMNWITIPKCGCACFRAWFKSSLSGEKYENVKQDSVLQSWFASMVHTAESIQGDCCAVVRDPVERAISCYFDKVLKRHPERKISEWIDFLEEDLANSYYWDEHYRPMTYFAPSGSIFIHLERLELDIAILELSRGIKMFKPINGKERMFDKLEISFIDRQRIARVYKEDIVRFYPNLISLYGLTH